MTRYLTLFARRMQSPGKDENMSENKMGTMPVGKLLFSMSLPIIISMLVQALYNVVDRMR